MGVAAIGAIQHEIAHKFPEIETDTTARQFCGAMVAEVMRRHGHDVVQARGRLGGTLFSYGAVFSAYPQLLPFTDVVAALARLPDRLAAYAAHVPAALWTRRPDGTGFRSSSMRATCAISTRCSPSASTPYARSTCP